MSHKVLVVEDNPVNQMIVTSLLENEGFLCDTAADGLEAVAKFKESSSGEYSLIFMDYVMPNLDGIEATKQIRSSSHPDSATVRIVGMSGEQAEQDTKRYLQAGMNDFLPKPVSKDSLIYLAKKNIDG